MKHTDPHDTDEPRVTLTIELSLPSEKAGDFLEAMTGDDRDILLAAERAMRERIDCDELELDWPGRMREVEEFLAQEREIAERRERLYGPKAAPA